MFARHSMKKNSKSEGNNILIDVTNNVITFFVHYYRILPPLLRCALNAFPLFRLAGTQMCDKFLSPYWSQEDEDK